ncbi:MAG: hypothetical protein AVDCRST_MAG37-3211, partial [uncultured Rubrobacteraceae bacterium]
EVRRDQRVVHRGGRTDRARRWRSLVLVKAPRAPRAARARRYTLDHAGDGCRRERGSYLFAEILPDSEQV